MMNRWPDWWNQARRDLAHARNSLQAGDLEWSAFAAQQGAEKAVLALLLSLGGEPWGHSLARLIQVIPEDLPAPREILDAGRRLDKHYLPTRHPNGFSEGYPGDLYTEEEAEGAIRDGEKILAFCRSRLPGQEEEDR